MLWLIIATIVSAILFCIACYSRGTDISDKRRPIRPEGYPVLQSGFGGTTVVALDCEMISCKPDPSWKILPEKKKSTPKDLVHVAADCAIVDYGGVILYKAYIRPKSPDNVVDWMGKEKCNLECGEAFDETQKNVMAEIKGNIVVAHDIWKDLNSLQLDHPISHIRDTSTCQLLREKAGLPSTDKLPRASLKDLAERILKCKIHKKTAHDPVEDARVAMELYRTVEHEWEKKGQ